MSSPTYDVVIVGGGIIGLATARELLIRRPRVKLAILEKELVVATHQTTHNSGVIHSGIYYRPGSIKARTCVAGASLMKAFCREHGIAVQVCGKVVVATDPSEVPILERLRRQGAANGVPGLSLIGPERLREMEPYARGVSALHVPGVAVVDFGAVARTFAAQVEQRGGVIRTSAEVRALTRRESEWVIETTAGAIRSALLVTTGGLYADRLAVAAGAPRDLAIIPFRGEYDELVPERRSLVRGMIYPVPKAGIPFLGVHFTRTVSGGVEAGPNAVLALSREGYRKTDVNLRDMLEMLRFRGFWNLGRRYWAVGLGEEYRAWNKRSFVRELQRLVPSVRQEDLRIGKRGVRAQAVDLHGSLVDDFNIVQGANAIYVRNVPSPAATASIAIAQAIVRMAETSIPTPKATVAKIS